ncbi:MAG TPA: glycosyltransferase family 39 protein [Terracidiphilus sp.]
MHPPPPALRNRTTLLFLSLLFAAAFLVRIWGLSKFHYWDEMVYLQNALVICCGRTNYSELDFRPPLLSLFFAGVFLLWRHIYAACITTALLNALGPVFLFFAGRRSVGRLPAALAAILLAFAPFFLGIFPASFASDDTGNSLLTDSPALTLVLLSFWLLLRALDRPTATRFFSAGFALALCTLMRFGSIPSVGMLLLLPLFSPARWKALPACIAGIAAALAPYLLWSRHTYGGFLSTLQAGWRNVEGPVQPFLFFLQNAATIFTPLAIAGLLLSLLHDIYLLRRRPPANPATPPPTATATPGWIKPYLWLWLALGLLFFSSMPHKEPRYIMPLAAPVLLLAGSGLSLFTRLPAKALRTAAALCLGLLLFVTFLPLRSRLSDPFLDPGVPEEELAGARLQSNLPAATTLYMSFNYPAWAYYTSFRIHELSSVGPELYRDLTQIPPGQVLIVYREAEDKSQSDLARVDANSTFTRIAEYPSFVIYRAKLPSPPQPGANALP